MSRLLDLLGVDSKLLLFSPWALKIMKYVVGKQD